MRAAVRRKRPNTCVLRRRKGSWIVANYRRNRINEELQRELCAVLREVKDPRLSRALISVTAVEATPDLKFAKAFYSTLGSCDDKEVRDGLRSAGGYIRTQIAQRLNLRQTPEFTFIRDRSAENGAHISSLLKQVEKDLHDPEEAPEGGEKTTDDPL